jgi:hypothetical protein
MYSSYMILENFLLSYKACRRDRLTVPVLHRSEALGHAVTLIGELRDAPCASIVRPRVESMLSAQNLKATYITTAIICDQLIVLAHQSVESKLNLDSERI